MSFYTVRPISDPTVFRSGGRRRDTPFYSDWSGTLDLLQRELRHLGAKDVVLEMDVQEYDIRIDGGVRANARPASPRVRVAFESKYGPLSYAADAFTHWQANVRAIALALEALRKVDRYGITDRAEQYQGFKALPAGRAMPASHMTADEAWAILGSFGNHTIAEQRQMGTNHLRDVLKKARAFAHPDRHDGDRHLWDQVEEAGKVLKVVT